MTQLIELNGELEDTRDELLPCSAISKLRDVLQKAVEDRDSVSPPESHPGLWLNHSAKSQFQACLALLEEELTKSVLPSIMSATEMERVQAIFKSILNTELPLLDSTHSRSQRNGALEPVLSSSPWHAWNIVFTTDFDVTCTVVDSCETLVTAAEAAAMRRSNGFKSGKYHEEYEAILNRHLHRTEETLCGLETKKLDIRERTTRLSGRDENSADLVPGMDPSLKSHFVSGVKSILRSSNENSRVVPFDEASLRRALTKLSDLEILCNQDIMSAGVLGGSSKEEIRAEARQVVLRDYCPRVLQRLVNIGTNIHVVSANWSRDLIIGGLPQLPHDTLFVHCNDLLFDNSGVSTGAIDMTVVDAFDKEEMLRALRKMNNAETCLVPKSDMVPVVKKLINKEKMMVYMGDSYTDLLGLLEADLGIVIGQSTSLRRVMSLYGIQLFPLSVASADIFVARLTESERSWRGSGILFEAQGWDDIETCLFGFAISASTEPSKAGGQMQDNQSSQQQQLYSNTQVSLECLPPVNLELGHLAC